ncbi:lmo0954 family membrane protein [Priestia flexa]|uniref:lmo0954 family membrane protein n=2 Tax=Priestia flexa TaxID=86664 RepID=UPI001F1DA6E4|nr:flagellar basal body rod protein [Priestia flexa]MED4589192.1 flagellar basal body rod protein [Priestia flexa]WEZ07584.1 flagellar basal body rod protein [Priestia flexa]WHX80353.1 flagellar basal body rod protein [Priestia flexa]
MMKKFGLFILGLIAAVVLIANLGPMMLMLLGLVILYGVWKQVVKATSSFKKAAFAVLGVIVILSMIANVPAFFGILAAIALYFVYTKWNDNNVKEIKTEDPFQNFENQWTELNKQSY